jgi:anionic cell wall polymer biosynthesis LytR-Cps2A-Psr (LCP) family protein
MGGERALKYVRSRNAQGEEGTDTARVLRQQNFLTSFKDQVLSPKTIFNPKKVLGLLKVLLDSTITDLKKDEYFNLGLSFFRFDPGRIKMETLNGFPGGLLYHPVSHYSRQWVLVPKEGNWNKIQEFIAKNLP